MCNKELQDAFSYFIGAGGAAEGQVVCIDVAVIYEMCSVCSAAALALTSFSTCLVNRAFGFSFGKLLI